MDDQKRDDKLGTLAGADGRLMYDSAADGRLMYDSAAGDELSDADLDGVAGGQAASEEESDDGTQQLGAKK